MKSVWEWLRTNSGDLQIVAAILAILAFFGVPNFPALITQIVKALAGKGEKPTITKKEKVWGGILSVALVLTLILFIVNSIGGTDSKADTVSFIIIDLI